MIKKSVLKNYTKSKGIKLSKKAETILIEYLNEHIKVILDLAAREASFNGRKVISRKDILKVTSMIG